MAPSRSIQRLTRVVLGTAMALGAGGFASVAAALAAGAGSLKGPPSAGHDFTVAGLPLTYPSANLAALVILALAGSGLIALVQAGRCARRHAIATRRFRRMAAVAGSPPACPIRLADPRPLAFCAGLLRPRVYVSDGARRALDDHQLRAVLAHEEHHRVRRDPLRILAIACLADALFFLPAVGRLRDRYVALAELRADDAAVAACGGDPAPLAGAMMAFDAGNAAGTVGIAPERVDRLLGEPPALAVGAGWLLAAMLTIAAMATAAWWAGRSAAVRASFALPVLSHRACVLALAAVPLALAAVTPALTLRTRRDRARAR